MSFMFTGLIEQVAPLHERIIRNNGMTTFCVAVDDGFSTKLGDSIALDGCCVTVSERRDNLLFFDLSEETLAVTTLGFATPGQLFNIERALQIGGRLGGHFVTGHVDGVATVGKWEPLGDGSSRLSVILQGGERGLLVSKGSLCLGGVSLTLNVVNDSGSEVLADLMLIPHTLRATNLGSLSVGSKLNYETDLLGKYVRQARTAYTY